MTRINVVPVKELTRQHLVAEYREIMRLPKNLAKSLNRKTSPFSMSEIPPEYVLGSGHVKFFYNKMKYLKKRFDELVQEMVNRGYTVSYTDSSIFDSDEVFFNDYEPTEDALRINRERIKRRLEKNESVN